MRWRGLTAVVAANLKADRGSALIDAAAAAVGAAALTLFVSLGLGVGDAAKRMFPANTRQVDVIPAQISLGGLLGGGRLDEAARGRLAALPGVVAVWPRQNLVVPVAAPEPPRGLEAAWPPGMTLQIPVIGIDPAMVAEDLPGTVPFVDPRGDGAIPVVLSRRLVEIYNTTIAPTWGIPGLPPGLDPVGVEMPVRIGVSIIPGKSESRIIEVRVKLAGLSDRVPLYAMAVPLATVQRLHRLYRRSDPGFGQVTLLAREPRDATAIANAARRMGFAIDTSEQALAERVGMAATIGTLALTALALLMTGLAALAIARSREASVAARSRELALLQALGATASDVRALVLLEALAIGASGGVAGALAGRLIGAACDLAWASFLPNFPFRPETIFSFPPWLLLASIAVAVASALAGAIAPAAQAARIDPARALS